MEVAPGGSGDEPVTAGAAAGCNIGLFVARAAARLRRASSAAVLVVQEHQRPASARRPTQERYGDVLAAARDEVEAFINIDYRNAQESIDAVAAGATGEFAEQYDTSHRRTSSSSSSGAKSVMDGEVLWAGVVDARRGQRDGDRRDHRHGRQHVDRQQAGRPLLPAQARPAVRVDGEWQTSNLEFVG